MRTVLVWLAMALVGTFLPTMAWGQDVLDRDSWNVAEGDWGNDDNWVDDLGELSGVPTSQDDRWALVGSGVANVTGDFVTSGLTIGAGATVDVMSGATLEVALVNLANSVGQTQVDPQGTLRINGGGSYKGLDGNILGILDMDHTASFEMSGDANLAGTYNFEVTSSGNARITAGGRVTVGGVIAPIFNGTNPGFGQTMTFVEADSVLLNNPALEFPTGVSLPRGLQANIVADNGNASISIDNVPILQVDRGTADAKIMNVIGGPIEVTGYAVESELGLLDPGGFSGFGGATWDRPNPLNTVLSEFNLTDIRSIAVDESLDIGKVYNGGATLPADEDVTFVYFTPDGDIKGGLVEYTGPANDLVLNANPETGEVTIQNLSAFIDPVEVTGYSVISPSNSLVVGEWTSLEKAGNTGWLEANPAAGFISEVNPTASTIFDNGTVVSLGNIFDVENGQRDLVLQYTTATDFLAATVEYQVTTPMNDFLEADFDRNGIVDFADFLTLSGQFNQPVDPPGTPPDINGDGTVNFPDFLVLSSQFGKSSGGAAAVPEPDGLGTFALGSLLLLAGRRRRALLGGRKQ